MREPQRKPTNTNPTYIDLIGACTAYCTLTCRALDRDLFYGLWIPDLFMRRVEENGEWCLMCPAQCPGLAECWGKEFDELYTTYERVSIEGLQ